MKNKECVFCDIARERIIAENEYCVAFYLDAKNSEQVTEKMKIIFESFKLFSGWKPPQIFED